MKTEFEFERGELLSNLTLLEDHAQKFACPYCMEKHASKIIGYAEEIAMGKEGDEEMLMKLADDAREWRRKIQDLKGHSHTHKEDNPSPEFHKCMKDIKAEGKCKPPKCNPAAVCAAATLH